MAIGGHQSLELIASRSRIAAVITSSFTVRLLREAHILRIGAGLLSGKPEAEPVVAGSPSLCMHGPRVVTTAPAADGAAHIYEIRAHATAYRAGPGPPARRWIYVRSVGRRGLSCLRLARHRGLSTGWASVRCGGHGSSSRCSFGCNPFDRKTSRDYTYFPHISPAISFNFGGSAGSEVVVV